MGSTLAFHVAQLTLSVVFHDDGLGRSTDIAEQQGRSGENVLPMGVEDLEACTKLIVQMFIALTLG